MKLPPLVILAAGHGGSDTGAVSRDFAHNERDQAIVIVDHAAGLLRSMGVEVVVAPHAHDTHETIAWMGKYNWGDAWAVEVHRDSANVREPAASHRFGMYYGSSDLSRRVARAFIKEVRAQGADDSSWARSQTESRFSRLGWIAQPKTLSHLAECGFMEGSNTPAHMYVLATRLARGIATVMRTEF